MRIKKNDLVIILAGKERGMTGRVLKVLPRQDRVIVEGRNMVQRHVKANVTGQGEEGGIIPREAPMSASNVALYSEKAGRGVRVRSRYVGEGGQLFATQHEAAASFGDEAGKVRKVRYAPQTEEVFD